MGIKTEVLSFINFASDEKIIKAINETLANKNITSDNLIDIKISASNQIIVLIIYKESEAE